MAKTDLEMKIIVDGPMHIAFMELAEECARQGVRIDSVSFNWFSPTSFIGTEREQLVSVSINSSKSKG